MKSKKENLQERIISVCDVLRNKFKVMLLYLLRSKFFEGVNFKNKSVENSCKESFAIWVLNLQKYKHIKVRKFKDLFTQLDEVQFPVKVIECTGLFSIHAYLIDSKQEKYYLINDGYYSDIYVIGRRNSTLEPFVDRDFTFKIFKDDGISFLETGILEIDRNGNNKDVSVNISYDTKKVTTIAISKSYKYDRQIVITYPTMNDDLDKKVQKYLLEIAETKSCYNDVFPILVWLCTQVKEKNISISIVAKIKEEISSQINVENGIVKKHISTQKINERESRRFRFLLSKDLKTFLSENT